MVNQVYLATEDMRTAKKTFDESYGNLQELSRKINTVFNSDMPAFLAGMDPITAVRVKDKIKGPINRFSYEGRTNRYQPYNKNRGERY